MKFLPAVLSLAVAFAFSSCNEAKYAKNQASKDAWLSSVAGRTNVDVSGVWEAVDQGWGSGRLIQSGNRITGSIGSYSIEGRVAGRSVFLAFNSNGWTYYTARLRKEGAMLTGFYSSSVPFSSSEQWALTLKRP